MDLVPVFTAASTNILGQLADVAPIALGVGVAFWGVRRLWRLFKGVSN